MKVMEPNASLILDRADEESRLNSVLFNEGEIISGVSTRTVAIESTRKAGDSTIAAEHLAKGLSCEAEEDWDGALSSYALYTKLVAVDSAGLLPDGLRKLGSVYFRLHDYDNAIKCLTLEKAFYEAEFLNLSSFDSDDGVMSHPPTLRMEADSARADKFEALGRFFLKEKHFDLAKEYAVKALRCRRRAQPGTTEFMAEDGRRQYRDTLQRIRIGSKSTLFDDAVCMISPPNIFYCKPRMQHQNIDEPASSALHIPIRRALVVCGGVMVALGFWYMKA